MDIQLWEVWLRPSRLSIVAMIAASIFLFGHVPSVRAADPVQAGYRDFSFPVGTGGNSEATGDKPESKLWWNDGLWWGILWNTQGNAYHIYYLNLATQDWIDTGVAVDDRNASRADALWDGQHMNIVSHIFYESSGILAPAGERGEFYRYSYDAGTNTYSLDAGYPVEVTLGKSETLVLEKDSTGRLWVAYTEGKKAMVNHSTVGDDHTWGTPYPLPLTQATKLSNDDIASLISYNGRIGVMWSNQAVGSMYFAIHLDSDSDAAWQAVSVYAPGGAAADDHVNLKSLQIDSSGGLFAVVKTSLSEDSDPLIHLLVCRNGTNCALAINWKSYVIYSKVEDHTRAILLIDTTNRMLHVFSTSPKFGGVIYRKSSSMDNIQFAAGDGVPFIQSATDKTINDATSTKQSVNSTTGLVVLASDIKTFKYLHNYMSLVNADAPSVKFSSASYSVDENVAGGSKLVTVSLSKVLTSTVTVNYATSNGTATAGSDYTALNGVLTFTPGETSKTFLVSILDDGLDESDETINLELSSPTNAVLGIPSAATLTITDNDNPPTVQFGSPTYSVNESGGTATITATLGAPSGLPVTVNYVTSNGMAIAGSDYTATSGTLTFNPGETSKTFTVPITQDTVIESNETVNLTLNSPSNATLGTPTTATLTIVDDDTPPTVQFSSATYSVNENGGSATVTALLSNPSGQLVTVHYATSNGTATAGSDYQAASGGLTFNPGETSKAFTIAIIDDPVSENAETINLTLSEPGNATLGVVTTAILTIVDNDILVMPTVSWSGADYSTGEQSGAAPITAMLSAASTITVTVNYATSNGTATAGSDYLAASGTLTFNPGQTSKTFDLSILDDALDENDETVNLTLSAPNNATLGSPAAATLTIVDNDNAPTVQLSAATYSIREQGGSAVITATLNAPSGITVTVHYGASNGTAASNDYTATSGVLTFSPGQTSRTFTVPIVADTRDESDETVHLALSSPTQASLGEPSNALLTIVDANSAPADPTVQFSTATYQVNEQAGGALITVTLSAVSTKAVSINYATSNGTATADNDYVAITGTLTFNPGETSKTFTVPIMDDGVQEDDETVNLTLSAPGNATLGTPVNSLLTIVDNDALPPLPTVQFSTQEYVYGTNNSGSDVSVEVRLSAAFGKPVTVNYLITKETGAINNLVLSGTLTFAPGEMSKTVAVPISPDDLTGSNKTIRVTLNDPVNANLGMAIATLSFVENGQNSLYLPFIVR
ncbi:MAG: hypothetical protein NT075_24020 [Chloroflexi bacterium]|nr:hypothetical protein [Chloroflexota bacterium]